jgi:hypothetical protein
LLHSRSQIWTSLVCQSESTYYYCTKVEPKSVKTVFTNCQLVTIIASHIFAVWRRPYTKNFINFVAEKSSGSFCRNKVFSFTKMLWKIGHYEKAFRTISLCFITVCKIRHLKRGKKYFLWKFSIVSCIFVRALP